MKQVWIDTKVFIRFLVKDQETQYGEVREIFSDIEKGDKRGIISILVVNEIIWILERYYKLERHIYLPGFIKLLALKNIKVAEIKKKVIIAILEQMRNNSIDFTDLYLISQGEKVVTFDKKIQKLVKVDN